jgi:CRISPR-associated protein Cas6
MTTIDLLFPVVGTRLPADHGYGLYSALSRTLPCLHDAGVRFGLAPITGPHIGDGLLQIDPSQSRLRLRLSAADIPHVLLLAGKGLDVLGHRIRLGVPQIEPLHPAPSLIARTVAIKKATEVGSFLQVARLQLDELGIAGKPRVPEHLDKRGHREPIRRILRIKNVRIVAFSLLVEGLTPEESVRLQEAGLGGRRHLGCGVFLPARLEEYGRGN